jgi:predicted PurR-regulated permease PerM
MRSEAHLWFVRGAALAFGAILAIGIAYTLVLGVEVVVLVFLALLLAAGVEPLIDRVRTRSPFGRGATLLLIYAFVFGAVAVVALLVVPAAINQLSDLDTKLTPLLNDLRTWASTIEPRALSSALVGLIDTAQRALAPGEVTAPDPDDLIALGLTFAEIVISVVSLLALF